MTNHPSVRDLALYAGRELGLMKRLRLHWHVKDCAACQGEVAGLQASRESTKAMAQELPPGVDWSVLEREMRANIHLGMAAGEAIRPAPVAPQRIDWRAGLALASLTAVVMTGWFLNAPRTKPAGFPVASMEAGYARLASVKGGIELKKDDQRLTLLVPAESSYTVDTHGGVSARSVDENTGQVTIANVSLE